MPTAREVGASLVRPLTSREVPEPPRTSLGRWSPWLVPVFAVVPLLQAFDLATRPDDLLLNGPLAMAFVVGAVALAILGRRPLPAWRVSGASVLMWMLLDGNQGHDAVVVPMSLTGTFVLAALVVVSRHRRALGWGVWGWTAALLVLGASTWEVLPHVMVLTLVVLLIDTLRQRAGARAEVALERSARVEEQEHSLVLEERARIARDLHDVVAHHMSMVAVQAETAQYRLVGVDTPVQDEFASIARSARSALGDVRGILTVLRATGAEVERAPQPTLRDLDALAHAARAAGAPVRVAVRGRTRPLPATVEIAAYRIVQESLANATRHARGAAVEVLLDYRDRHLQVTVTNGPGRAAAPAPDAGSAGQRGGGHGLVGMRERAHLLEGELVATPTPDGGFQVAATLPTEVAPR
ncbi:hypothetical protein N869_16810 [Cellulomonas bogoriensis 69B4 = DSM 16987]|uniref:histidine kinase n=1 Tax=Cellulomonas bogoriensis 69B4 = DSM 16987 TaxID=1386082 RepID=A0A0A0BZ61_9CELL|nr:hypothetical protein N869_16810 [Cellulomonas bogoriensis 69B4 = DSM 16987]